MLTAHDFLDDAADCRAALLDAVDEPGGCAQAARYVLLRRLVEGIGLSVERGDMELRHAGLFDFDLIAFLALPDDDIRRNVSGR